jgi:aspartyl-tRNA(Asn)/glutamyl-tRNA(Gln) amidotransferase subunit A
MGGSTERSAYGVCKNAWDDTKVPGGSSGGSAVAVALDMCAFALGSDTGGSVRQPSAYNGTYGIKPTYSRISRYGLIAFASSLDQIGPITKTVADNAYVLGIMAGYDINDATSGKMPVPDYMDTLENDISGMRIGIIKEVQELISTTEYADLYRGIERWFASHNARVTEVSIKDYQLALPVYYTVAPAEATSNLGRFDGVKYTSRSDKATEIEDVYTLSRTEGFGDEVKRRIMLGNFVLSSGYYEDYYKKAKKIQQMLKKEFARAFEDCDVIIMPTAFGEAFDINAKTSDPLSMYIEDMFTISANIVGVPAMSIPCGKGKHGLPLGLQILAKEWDEKVIYQVARYFEKMYKEESHES